jgi:hypothetical protein
MIGEVLVANIVQIVVVRILCHPSVEVGPGQDILEEEYISFSLTMMNEWGDEP